MSDATTTIETLKNDVKKFNPIFKTTPITTNFFPATPRVVASFPENPSFTPSSFSRVIKR